MKLIEDSITQEDEELKNLVDVVEEKAASYFNKDSIMNLCLLDRKTNSSVGNKFFAEKRENILGIDKMTLEDYNQFYGKVEKIKPFIPLATKHIFLKYFTEEGDVQMSFWGSQDRRDYLSNIKIGIEKFLKTTN